MNFEEFIRHVTSQERGDRALKDFKAYLVGYFFLEHPNALRPQIEKDAEQWAELIIDKRKHESFINDRYAALVREQFLKFKEEDKSRKAKKSRSMLKPDEQAEEKQNEARSKRGRVKRKDDKRLGGRPPG